MLHAATLAHLEELTPDGERNEQYPESEVPGRSLKAPPTEDPTQCRTTPCSCTPSAIKFRSVPIQCQRDLETMATLFSSQSSAFRPRASGSVYGGSGGSGVRVSSVRTRSLGAVSGGGGGFSMVSGGGGGFSMMAGGGGGGFSMMAGGGGGGLEDALVMANDKQTMQNLNDRLASYLERVRSLEAANSDLELKIREFLAKKVSVGARDYSPYYKTIAELQEQIIGASVKNAMVVLQIDNAKLASDDFRVKYENELSLRQSVEADIMGLRKVLDNLTMTRSDLEMQIEGLKEELIFLKKNHEEEMAVLRSSMGSSSVNVEVDAAPQQDLSRLLEEMRAQYDSIIEKNRREMEGWYKDKFDALNQQVQTSSTEIQTSRSEISELKRTLQALEIELQSQLSLKMSLEGTLAETEGRFSGMLMKLQGQVTMMEQELVQIREDAERQGQEAKETVTVTVKKVEPVIVVPEPEPEPEVSRSRIVKTIVEEIVDGKVVSSEVQEVQETL
ncbi:hypothetical protein JZ751_008046 [Albula glossodonta]|uniref:IF rod domain-containing protein n=1 Tax=Albula glossodonta TaxID=121402 RepID=A0A8T2P4M2_9TELE|nr:hypothetical protein JZ751_008046 [Albula glossodonta]